MQKIEKHSHQFRIVALPYYDIGDQLDSFMEEAIGQRMTLRPDPSNEFDKLAIGAYDWEGRHVGYVSRDDREIVYRMLRGSGRQSLRGKVTERKHKCLILECVVSTTYDEMVDDDTIYFFKEWQYSGPVIPPTRETVKLEYMVGEIEDRLDEQLDWNEDDMTNFVLLMQRFIALSKFDISSDMVMLRRRLALELNDLDDDRLKDLSEELLSTNGRAGRETQKGEVNDYWMKILKGEAGLHWLTVHEKEFDAEKVRQELNAFPESIYEEWLKCPDLFVSKLYYLSIPREVLWKLVSGIVFTGMVDAKSNQGLHNISGIAPVARPSAPSVNIHVQSLGQLAVENNGSMNMTDNLSDK